jgi:hypothetical protein
MAINDNPHPSFGLIESVFDGQQRWAVVEYDRLGPVLRLGPFAEIDYARDKLRDYTEMRRLEFELLERQASRRRARKG